MLSVRKDLNKVIISDIDLTGNTLYINQIICPNYRIIRSKTKTYQKRESDSFYVSNGNIKIRIQEND